MGFWDANSDRDWQEWVHEYDRPRPRTNRAGSDLGDSRRPVERRHDPDPGRAVASDLGALVGNVLAEIREAEADYHVVYAQLLDSEGKANRATIRAQMTPEWKRLREAKDTLKLIESMTAGLRAIQFAERTVEKLTR